MLGRRLLGYKMAFFSFIHSDWRLFLASVGACFGVIYSYSLYIKCILAAFCIDVFKLDLVVGIEILFRSLETCEDAKSIHDAESEKGQMVHEFV